MPAKSQAQQHLMQMAYAVRKGKMKAEDVPSRVRNHVVRLARDEDIDVEGFTKTDSKRLPKHVGTNMNRGGRVRSS